MLEPKRKHRENLKFKVIDKETKYHQGKGTKKGKEKYKAWLSSDLMLYLKFSVVAENILYKHTKCMVSTVRYFYIETWGKKRFPQTLLELYLSTNDVYLPAAGLPRGSMVKNLPANAGDASSIPGSGRFPEGENGKPL